MEESALTLIEYLDGGWLGCGEQPPVGADAVGVVDVEVATDRSSQGRLVRSVGEERRPGILLQVAPTLAAVVDVVEVEPGLVEEVRQSDVGPFASQ